MLLIVIDGLGAASLQRAIAAGHAPHIARLVEAGAHFDEAISPFPSLTPVCLATIATGVGPDKHRVPSLGWYNRGRGRFIEYGSSFAATGVEGMWRGVQDVIVDLNHEHLSEHVPTIFERVQDAGMEAASINYLVSRGRTRHTMKHDYGPVRALGRRTKVNAIYGPDHLYFGELYGSVRPFIPQLGIKRPLDWGGGVIARHLIRQTDSQFILLYLGQHDAASHKSGPDSTQKAIAVADRAVGRCVDTLGGVEEFLDQFGIVICADHGQTHVHHHTALEDVFDDVALFRGSRIDDAHDRDLAIIGSNRVAMAYRTHQDHRAGDGSRRRAGTGPTDQWIARRAAECPATDISAWFDREHREIRVVGGPDRVDAELRIRRDPEHGTPTVRAASTGDASDRWHVEGDLELLDIGRDEGTFTYGDYPDALQRLTAAIDCVNTGDVLISAAPGWEFHDIGGGSHTGGSHGSLHIVDSTAPLITAGLDHGASTEGLHTVRLTDIAPLVSKHLALDAAMAARGR
jgi:hypothetical protein